MNTSDPITLQKLRRLKELKESYGLAFYEPHPKQDLFHRAGDKRRRYVRTGNRFGKSQLGAAEDCAWAVGERMWYAKDDPARYVGIPQRPTKGLIIVADWEKAHEIFTNPEQGANLGKLWMYLPKGKSKAGPKNNAGVVSVIYVESIWGGQSTIHLDTVKSFKANPMGQESSDWDWIHVDEPCPEDMWKANSRGLMDRGGSAWFTCTPLNEPWINDEFVPSRRTRIEVDKPLEKDKYHWMITGSSRDNPYLNEEDIALFEASLDDAERQCRIEGLPLALSGLIYKQFKYGFHTYAEAPHGWVDPTRPPNDYMLRVAIDTHPETPHAILFEATSPLGLRFYYYEMFRKALIREICEGIHETTQGQFVQHYICDPSAFIEHPVDGSSMADAFFEGGVPVEKAPKDLQRGILANQAVLAQRNHTSAGAEVPAVLFGEHLTETLWEFDHYEWDIKRDNKPVDKNDHMMENFYRLTITHPGYIAPDSSVGPTIIPFTKRFEPDLRPPSYGLEQPVRARKPRYGR